MQQDLRSFVEEYGTTYPGDFIRVSEPVGLEFDLQAFVLELERRRRFPILLFEKIAGSEIPVVCNVMASRRALAFALGVHEPQLPEEYARRLKQYIEPVEASEAPFRQTVLRDARLDLSTLPIPTYFPNDGGPYITAGLLAARDPDTGVITCGIHRLQLKAPTKLGVSLHSRRRMFEYQRRAEAQGRRLECAIALGLHPAIMMGALAFPPPEVSKFHAIGGLFGAPLQIASCETVDLVVPASAEIVIEGEILSEVREPEGPFGEFTGYFSKRSTQHVFMATALCMRDRPWFQSISSGLAHDHILPLGIFKEAEIRNAVKRAIPNLVAVHVPASGCGSFTAFVSIKQTRPGEAKHAIPIVLGADQNVKCVVIVDDDVDVFNESDVLWALATRMQADRDLVVVSGSLGSLLDPSATEQGVTAKIGIDATRPFGQPFPERLRMSPEGMQRARALAERLGL